MGPDDAETISGLELASDGKRDDRGLVSGEEILTALDEFAGPSILFLQLLKAALSEPLLAVPDSVERRRGPVDEVQEAPGVLLDVQLAEGG